MAKDQGETKKSTANEHTGAAELAERERVLSKRIWLGNQFWVLLGLVLAYLAVLALPQITGVRGFQVVFVTEQARQASVKITEYVFSILALLGIGIFTPLTLIFRRTSLAVIAWIFCTISLFESLFAMWLRNQRPGSEDRFHPGVGMFLLIAIIVIGVFTYATVVLRRSPEQEKVAQQRAHTDNLDGVGYAQRYAGVRDQEHDPEENPVLIDDRRSRAARRHIGLTDDD